MIKTLTMVAKCDVLYLIYSFLTLYFLDFDILIDI